MQTRSETRRRATAALPARAVMLGALAVMTVLPVPADAQGLGFRAKGASGQNGAFAGARGVFSSGQGDGAAVQGRCAASDHASGCRGRAATWGSDGTFGGAAGTEITGENGFARGHRSLARDADGTWSGARSLDTSGQNGSYSGSASLESGTYSRGATYSGTEGQSATVEGNYQAGSGGARMVTCIDASGAVVACP